MPHVEPVAFAMDGESQDLDTDTLNYHFSQWSAESNWLLNKLLDDSYIIVDEDRIADVVRNATQEAFADLSDASPRVIDDIVEDTTNSAAQAAQKTPVVMSKNDVFILVSDFNGHLILVSEDVERIEEICSEWSQECDDLNNISRDFGITLDGLIRKHELAQAKINRIDGKILGTGESDNGLEETIYDEITSEITRCSEPNVEMQFNEDVYTDSFEFDILCYPTANFLLMVEVKDAVYEEKDFDKSELIRKQDEKVNLLDDKAPVDRVEGIVVTRDLDENKFNEFSGMADRGEVDLIKYDEGSFVNEIANMVNQQITREAIGTGQAPPAFRWA